MTSEDERPEYVGDVDETRISGSGEPGGWRNLLPGTQLYNYEIEGLLGTGGMGAVYLARHATLGHRYALKVVSDELSGDAQFRKQFRKAGRAMAALDHPNIVRVYDAGECETEDSRLLHYLVMEYMEAGDLNDYMRDQGGRLPTDEVVRILRQLLSALEYAHGEGIVHRDLKPGNLLLHKDGTMKVGDFDLARVAGEKFDTMLRQTIAKSRVLNEASTRLADEGRTEHGFFGTIQYMSPEALAGKKADPATDLYAVGVIGYELLTGRKPLGKFKNASALVHGLNRKWDGFLDRALQPEPSDRWQSASQMKASLERRFGGKSRNLISITVGLAAAIVILALWIWISGEEPPPDPMEPLLAEFETAWDTGDLAGAESVLAGIGELADEREVYEDKANRLRAGLAFADTAEFVSEGPPAPWSEIEEAYQTLVAAAGGSSEWADALLNSAREALNQHGRQTFLEAWSENDLSLAGVVLEEMHGVWNEELIQESRAFVEEWDTYTTHLDQDSEDYLDNEVDVRTLYASFNESLEDYSLTQSKPGWVTDLRDNAIGIIASPQQPPEPEIMLEQAREHLRASRFSQARVLVDDVIKAMNAENEESSGLGADLEATLQLARQKLHEALRNNLGLGYPEWIQAAYEQFISWEQDGLIYRSGPIAGVVGEVLHRYRNALNHEEQAREFTETGNLSGSRNKLDGAREELRRLERIVRLAGESFDPAFINDEVRRIDADIERVDQAIEVSEHLDFIRGGATPYDDLDEFSAELFLELTTELREYNRSVLQEFPSLKQQVNELEEQLRRVLR